MRWIQRKYIIQCSIVVYHMLENFKMKINAFLSHYMECMNVEKK